jgi:hypothetical protein
MNERIIRDHCRGKLEEWSTYHRSPNREFLSNAYIAGGALVNLLRNEDPNDYDVYFKDVHDLETIVSLYTDRVTLSSCTVQKRSNGLSVRIDPDGIWTSDTQDVYGLKCVSANALTLNDHIQIITKFAGEPIFVMNEFDFLHCKVTYNYATDQVIAGCDTYKAILTNELKYTGSSYPVASMLRMKKFVQRGWNINAGEILKIMIDVNELNLNDATVLRDQLAGVDMLYFNDVLRILNEDKYKMLEPSTALWDAINEVFN